jgi:PAS domain S-box-containing protein
MEGPLEPAIPPKTATKYELACRAAGIGVWEVHVAEDRLVYCEIARAIFGFPAEGPITRPMVYDVIHPDDAERVKTAAQRALDPKVRASESYSYRIRRFDTGETRWLIGDGIAYFDGEGPTARPLLYAGSIRDVTEHELTRQELASSEKRLRLAVDAAQMAIWDLDMATGEVAHSPDLNRMLGFPEDACPTLEQLRSRYAPGARERLEAEGAAATARGETSLQTRVNYIVPDRGEVTYVLRAALAEPEKPGETSTRVIGVLFDATEQARAEERLNTINGELLHRLKNMTNLAGIFARQTWGGDPRLETYLGRIRALAMSADLMFGTRDSSLHLHHVIDQSLKPFFGEFQDRIVLDGPDAVLPDNLLTGLALVLHELATNAVKYGALSHPSGQVALVWQIDGSHLKVQWTETGGPRVEAPSSTGFGLNLLRRGALAPPNLVTLDFRPEGLIANLTIVLDKAHCADPSQP